MDKPIRRVAVIGAGPVGCGLAKSLISENHFTVIDIYEKRSVFGGLWNYTKTKIHSKPQVVPSTQPNIRLTPQIIDNEVVFDTAVYKYLDTNVPKELMEYNEFPFPKEVPMFPTRAQVLDYLVSYSKEVEPYVKFNTEVIDAHYNGEEWNLKSENLLTHEISTVSYDAIAISMGQYDLPFIPEKPGLKKWFENIPDSILHSKNFDAPQDFADVKGNILVVGNSASGSDLAYELATINNRDVYKSKRSENEMPAGQNEKIIDVPDLKSFNHIERTVEFVDGSKLEDVDKVIFATGFLKSIPFLKGDDNPVAADGSRMENLYYHMLRINNPTLAILGLPKYVLPTRLSETQGSWLARVWSGRLSLPSKEDMEAYDRHFQETQGSGTAYHNLKFPMDVEYSQMLNEQIRSSGKDGYFGVEWTPDQVKLRGGIKPLKEAYFKYLEDTQIRAASIEELVNAGYLEWDS